MMLMNLQNLLPNHPLHFSKWIKFWVFSNFEELQTHEMRHARQRKIKKKRHIFEHSHAASIQYAPF